MSDQGTILRLAAKSLLNRRGTAALTLFSIAVSVSLLLGVEHIRKEARNSFASTISDTDLIVGARSGPLQLLLYSVFRMGSPTNNLSWESYQKIAASPLVKWTVPISLGDSHRGYRVLGTTPAYFEHYRYGSGRSLALASGTAFGGEVQQAVIGSEVAAALGYPVGTPIEISHGIGATSFHTHDEYPFTVVGILHPTGTPVDQTVHVPLAAIDLIHQQPGTPPDSHAHQGEAHSRADGGHDNHDQTNNDHEGHDHADHGDETHEHDDHGGETHEHDGHDAAEQLGDPESITAFLVGLTNRVDTLKVQRAINQLPGEALLAIIPGQTLQELWGLVGMVELALLTISGFVIVAGLLGLLASILTSLNERRREMAILRSVGARPSHIFFLMLSEAGLIAGAGAMLGVALQAALVGIAGGFMETRLGLVLQWHWPGPFELMVVLAVVLAATLLALWPAWRAYRNTLADGLTLRV